MAGSSWTKPPAAARSATQPQPGKTECSGSQGPGRGRARKEQHWSPKSKSQSLTLAQWGPTEVHEHTQHAEVIPAPVCLAFEQSQSSVHHLIQAAAWTSVWWAVLVYILLL